MRRFGIAVKDKEMQVVSGGSATRLTEVTAGPEQDVHKDQESLEELSSTQCKICISDHRVFDILSMCTLPAIVQCLH
jgi:hypothetical protein